MISEISSSGVNKVIMMYGNLQRIESFTGVGIFFSRISFSIFGAGITTGIVGT
jgi:hypothetical protein